MFQIKVVQKIKAPTLFSATFFPKTRTLYEIMFKNMAEPERTQALRRLRVAFWIKEQAHARTRSCNHTHTRERAQTHTQKYVIFIAFHGNSGSVNAPQCYVTRTLHVLLSWTSSSDLCTSNHEQNNGNTDKTFYSHPNHHLQPVNTIAASAGCVE